MRWYHFAHPPSHAMPLAVRILPQAPHSLILDAPAAFQKFRQVAIVSLHYIFSPRISLKLIQIELRGWEQTLRLGRKGSATVGMHKHKGGLRRGGAD